MLHIDRRQIESNIRVFAVCKMCGSSYTRLPICGVCYDTLMKYKKAGRLPKRLVPFAMAAGLMKG